MPSTETARIPEWSIRADYVETCNCDYGCPCNFNGFPTYGFCRALVLYHIRNGNYGSVRLDGVDVVFAASWPKAIHEGDGTTQLYISKKATDDQRKAVLDIFSGRAKGDGPFAVFASTFKYVLDPQFVDIIARIDGKKSSFLVPGVMEVQVESFKNPVTGEEQETKIHLPKGFIWKVAEAARTKIMRIISPSLSFDDSGKNPFLFGCRAQGPLREPPRRENT